MFFFWLEGHDMRVIEVDGTDVEEFPVDQVVLSVAQRVSVLVTAKNTTTNNFAVHYQFDESMFDVVPGKSAVILGFRRPSPSSQLGNDTTRADPVLSRCRGP